MDTVISSKAEQVSTCPTTPSWPWSLVHEHVSIHIICQPIPTLSRLSPTFYFILWSLEFRMVQGLLTRSSEMKSLTIREAIPMARSLGLGIISQTLSAGPFGTELDKALESIQSIGVPLCSHRCRIRVPSKDLVSQCLREGSVVIPTLQMAK